MSWQEPPPQEKETEEQESNSLEDRGHPDAWQAGAGKEEEQEREAFSHHSSFDYARLDQETRQFVEGKAIETHGLLKRTAEHITAIGTNLLAVKECLPHGQFLVWLSAEFGLSRYTASRFMRVASRLGNKCVTVTHLPAQVLYELASPSTPQELVEAVMSGAIPSTRESIAQTRAGLKQAQEAERELDVAAQEEKEAREIAQRQEEQIRDLTRHIRELHQQIALMQEQPEEATIIEKLVVPPQMQADLEHLQQQVQDLTLERERLMEQVERLGAHNRAEFLERNEVARHQRIRQQWRSVTLAWEKSTRELSACWPTLLDTESFVSEEWATLHHIKLAAAEMIERCEQLVQAREMIVDSGL